MPASDLFAHLLSVKLQEEAGQKRAVTAGTIRTHPFEPTSSGSSQWEALNVRIHQYVTTGAAVLPPRPSTPAVRSLNPDQRVALTALRRLGARLTDDFDPCQLKAAFRRLALELHPDRHPAADSIHRQWLGTRFAVLCEAYRTLNAAQQS